MKRRILAPSARLQTLQEIAKDNGWKLVIDRPRTHTQLRAFAWTLPEGRLVWVEHHSHGVRFLEVDTEFPPVLAALPTLEQAALEKGCADRDPGTAIHALNALFHLAVVDAFYPALAAHAVHPNVWVRRSALNLTAYCSGSRTAAAIAPAVDDEVLGEKWRIELERLQST